jgi:hypothetical protein
MSPRQWARVRVAGAHGLRRGAWYPVVNDTKPTIVLLDVNKRNVPIDRSLLEFSIVKPDRWSIVVWNPSEPASARDTDTVPGASYGVCPQCRSRADIEAGALTAECPDCGGAFGVDWDNTC